MSGRDWTPPPLPTEEQFNAAAADLLHIADLEPLRRGHVTFRRPDLELVSWWDPSWGIDFDGDPDEVTVPLKPLADVLCDDSVAAQVQPELQRRQNLARCKLAIRQAIDRLDQSMVLTGEALEADR